MIEFNIFILGNQKNPDVDACISFFERYFEYDDDIEVDVNTLKYFANFLRKHRPEKKLDTFFLNMIESDKVTFLGQDFLCNWTEGDVLQHFHTA
jgi:hypothetical protein